MHHFYQILLYMRLNGIIVQVPSCQYIRWSRQEYSGQPNIELAILCFMSQTSDASHFGRARRGALMGGAWTINGWVLCLFTISAQEALRRSSA